MAEEAGWIGLAEFLQDLRVELEQAQSAASGDRIQLGVEEITVTMDVVYTATRSAETSAKIGAKFWVVASAEAGIKGALGSTRSNTQHISLTLKPRIDEVTVDGAGNQVVASRGLDVRGGFAAGEEQPTPNTKS